MAFLHALGGVFSLLIAVAIGFYLAGLGWFPPDCRRLLPRLVTNVALPPFLACTIISSFQRDNLLHMLYAAMPPFVAMAALFALAYAAGKIMRVSGRHFGLFCACVSNPNTIFIGIPVNMALFGQEAVPYVLLYYFASTCFFWTVGNYFISRDVSASPDAGAKDGSTSAFQWRKIISAPMYGFLTGVCVVFLDAPPPDFLFQAARIIGELTTPLALLFIGVTLEGIGMRNLRLSRDMLAALLGRMVVSPLLVWLILPIFGLPPLMNKVFVIQSSLPVLMQVAILSAYYNTDPDFGSIMVSISTMLCALTVPIYMVLL